MRSQIFIVGGALCAAFFIIPGIISAQTTGTNRPPVVSPIHANLIPPVTTYTVEATDLDGDPLTYSWDSDISCGRFMPEAGPSSKWDHPDETSAPYGCPHEDGTDHEGTITVRVSDGQHAVFCSFDGSETGDGPLCESTATSRTFGVPSSLMRYVYEICYWLWLPLLLATALGGLWFTKNGLFINRNEEEADPCAELRRREAAARAKLNSAREKLDELERAKKAADDAEKKAKDAEAKAEKTRRDAGTRWSASGSTDWEGEHTEVHNEGWHDKEKGAAADAASAEAKAARDAANAAKGEFENAGGGSAYASAKSDASAAQSEWEAADAALRACIGGIGAPKPEPKPSAPSAGEGGSTGGTTGTSTGGGDTGGTSTPPTPTPAPTPPSAPEKKKEPEFVCTNGDKRNERTESITVSILDLPSVRLMQDKIYSDAGNEAMKFIDYLQTLKDLFMLGKSMKGGAEAYLEGSIEGASDAVGFPDFLTWYDKGVDALTKSMHELFVIIQDKQRLGDYWLEYRIKKLTLTCRKYEVCSNNRWVTRSELTVADNGFEAHRTNPESVHDVRELQRAISRLFTQLRNRYKGDQTRAKQFTQSCGG